jgi:histidyl-tRNA synthetase
MVKLLGEPLRGFDDIYPERCSSRNEFKRIIGNVLRLQGFLEYDGPTLELLDLYTDKTSADIVSQQIYSFYDRKQRQVALRPEMTPTLARMVSSQFESLPKPIRWFSFPLCYRYERPQRGRKREFLQLNVDSIAGDPLLEDLHVIIALIEIIKALIPNNEPLEVKLSLNHRGFIEEMLQKEFGVKETASVLQLMDRKDKLPPETFWKEITPLILKIDDFKDKIGNSFQDLNLDQYSSWKHLCQVQKILKDLYPQITIEFNPFIVRGFDYYTGIVFELFDQHPENRRALAGGGRYDNLLSHFSEDNKASGIGFGLGEEGIDNFLEVRKKSLVPKLKPFFVMLVFPQDEVTSYFELANSLRQKGLSIMFSPGATKIGKQIQWSEKLGATGVIFFGQDERNKCQFSVRLLKAGTQNDYSINNNLEQFFLDIKDLLIN